MISHLHNTTVSAINKELSQLRADNGSLSSGRVLTLVVLAEKGHSREAMRAAIRASHEHPSRVIVHISHDPLDPDQLMQKSTSAATPAHPRCLFCAAGVAHPARPRR